jgi:hypothetical protein
MDARSALNRSVSTGLHLARGTADRVVRVAGPPLGRVAGSVMARVRGPRPPASPATFTPTKQPTKQPVRQPAKPAPAPTGHLDEAPEATPSPAVVARNIAPQRPVATPPKKRSAPKSVPGAKLPPPRPSTS